MSVTHIGSRNTQHTYQLTMFDNDRVKKKENEVLIPILSENFCCGWPISNQSLWIKAVTMGLWSVQVRLVQDEIWCRSTINHPLDCGLLQNLNFPLHQTDLLDTPQCPKLLWRGKAISVITAVSFIKIISRAPTGALQRLTVHTSWSPGVDTPKCLTLD